MRTVVVIGVVAVFLTSVWGFGFVQAGFFPASTTPQIVVDYWLPEGTDISQTEADVVEIEGWLGELDGVAAVQALVGQGGLRFMLVYAPEAPNSAYGHFLIRTDDYGQISRLMPEIQQLLIKAEHYLIREQDPERARCIFGSPATLGELRARFEAAQQAV